MCACMFNLLKTSSIKNNYHKCNRVFLLSLGAVQVYVLMHHTKPGKSRQNLVLASNAVTCGIPFHKVRHARDLLLEAVVP